MALYRCENCGCVENTAAGFYYDRDAERWPHAYRGKALCSACGPSTDLLGSPTEFGRWHGLFRRRSAIGMLVDQMGRLHADDASLSPSTRIVGKVEADPVPPFALPSGDPF